MSFSRTTQNGRRITATARVREQPDTKTLVALVLHLADQLHDDEQAQQHASSARDDHDNHLAGVSSEDEEGTDNGTLTASTSTA